jgi:hypothetical protein
MEVQVYHMNMRNLYSLTIQKKNERTPDGPEH